MIMSRQSRPKPVAGTSEFNLDPAHFPNPSAAPLSFLVAEDDEFSARLLERLLIREGYSVQIAANGREAFDLAAGGDFDVLLLDIQLPQMDGFEVIHQLRERERRMGGHLPVVALTAGSSRAVRERCLAAGMDNFLHKPIQMDALRNAIQHAVTAPYLLARSGSDLIDAAVLLAASGHDQENLKAICREFLNGLPEYLADVQEAFHARDFSRLGQSAHRLGGMISTLSTKASAIALEIEDRAGGRQFEEIRPLIAQLAAMSADLIAAIQSISLESLRDKTRGRHDWH
jgi:two-component system, sensor histidine kinase and response regulator